MMQPCVPPWTFRRQSIDAPSSIAKRTGQSLSAVVTELTVRGLSQLDVPVVIATDELSGFPVISVGRRVTSEQVAAALDEE